MVTNTKGFLIEFALIRGERSIWLWPKETGKGQQNPAYCGGRLSIARVLDHLL